MSHQPPAFVHHLALGACDVERVAAFYSSQLGLPEVRRNLDDGGGLRSIWLSLGDTLLMVEHTARHRESVQGVDAGLFLIAFRVDARTRAEIEQSLTSLGHPVESRTEHTSYFRDPEGNRFAVSHYPIEGQPRGHLTAID